MGKSNYLVKSLSGVVQSSDIMKLDGDTIERFYDSKRDRILYYSNAADRKYWETHWKKYHGNNFKEAIESYQNSRDILKIVREYFQGKSGYILEGGCGIGGYVYCLNQHGYKVIGVDYAQEIIKISKNTFSFLNFVASDVRSIGISNESVDLYLSFGVIEHFIEGFDQIISEAFRVLKEKGVLVLTFPQISYLRRLKINLGMYSNKAEREQKQNNQFYQYLLNPNQVVNHLSSFGFSLIHKKSKGGLKGFKDEIILLKPVLQKVFDYKGKSILVRGLRKFMNQYFAVFCGHTCQMIFQKEKNNIAHR